MKKKELIIYEGAMCCPTGLCGPEPDPVLVQFSETLKKLGKEYGATLTITRASLTFNGLLFYGNQEVAQLTKENGPGILPVTTVDGRIVAKQRYLNYEELKAFLGEETEEA